MSDLKLPRSERLRSLKAIRRMFGEGKGGFVYPFRYVYYKHYIPIGQDHYKKHQLQYQKNPI